MSAPGLRRFVEKSDLTIEQLAGAARTLLVGLRQTRYKVTTAPDVRTLRFYTSEGLLDPPLSYKSGRARFGYRHLLQILAIKHLQAKDVPIRKIKTTLAAADLPTLEAL